MVSSLPLAILPRRSLRNFGNPPDVSGNKLFFMTEIYIQVLISLAPLFGIFCIFKIEKIHKKIDYFRKEFKPYIENDSRYHGIADTLNDEDFIKKLKESNYDYVFPEYQHDQNEFEKTVNFKNEIKNYLVSSLIITLIIVTYLIIINFLKLTEQNLHQLIGITWTIYAIVIIYYFIYKTIKDKK